MLRFNSAERREDAGPTTLDYAAITVAVVVGFVAIAFALRGVWGNTLYGAAWSVSRSASLKPGVSVTRPPVIPASTIRSLWASKFPTAITDEGRGNGYIRRYRFADGSSAIYYGAYLDEDGIVHKAVVEWIDAALDPRMTVTVHPYGLTNQASTSAVFERAMRDANGAIIATDFVQLSNSGITRGNSTRVLRYFVPPETKPSSQSSDSVINSSYKSMLDDARYFLSVQSDATK